MDANGQRFWMIADGAELDLAGGDATWDPARRVLRLASRRRLPDPATDRAGAVAFADSEPFTVDRFGTWATLSDDRRRVLAYGAFDEPAVIYEAAVGERVLDLAQGPDDVLYLAVGNDTVAAVVLLDRRERWAPTTLAAPDFRPDRVAPCHGGDDGAWAVDRRRGMLARVRGLPLRARPPIAYRPGTSRPCAEDGDPPRLELRPDLMIPASRELVAAAPGPGGRLGLLLWPLVEGEAELAEVADGELSRPRVLTGARWPFDLGWVGDGRWAVVFGGHPEALTYAPFGREGTVEPVPPLGDHYPLASWDEGRLCTAFTEPVLYLSNEDGNRRPRPLHRLSAPSLTRTASIGGRSPFDSGGARTEWHRLYLEASLPPGTGVRVFLRVADDLGALEAAEEAEHRFGVVPAALTTTREDADIPAGAWVAQPSEIPYHPGLLPCEPRPQHAGLFTVLVQRSGRAVRSLRGRYLGVRLELHGNGLSTPEVAALRVYAPRFSYRDRYLPELYREALFGSAADASGSATGADFLGRFLGLFEGVLTPLEDRVAAAHRVTDPLTAPAEALDWLASWVGLTLEPGLGEDRRRRMLREATRLYRARGTPGGLALALDIATGGLVAAGGVVILEDFRLRRTFATILGADLADEEDPLMMGIVSSGNSFVGDTLHLGEEERREFLALYTPEVAETEVEREAITALFERLANRVTVLVHREVSSEELGLVRRVVELETPAHVQARVLAASRPLLVGLTALVGVDTYLRPGALPKAARVEATWLGRGDYVLGAGALDPRLENAGSAGVQPGMRRPVAAADDVAAEVGESFTLDGSDSRAFDGREVVRYRWRREE